MPVRKVKQYSDRGKIKNLSERHINEDILPSPEELRLKKLYEYAQMAKDNNFLNALGFITTNYIEDKNALPLSVYRLRKIVEEIAIKSKGNIDQMKNELSNCFSTSLSEDSENYLNKRAMVKIATIRKPPIFRRVSE